jgi:hypothetical protein
MPNITGRHIPNSERPMGARNKTLEAHRLAKQGEAQERQAARKERSDQEQLALLDSRFGVGMGAQKERARLQARIQANASKPEHKPDEKKLKKFPKLNEFTK